jgi:hypothetical protein
MPRPARKSAATVVSKLVNDTNDPIVQLNMNLQSISKNQDNFVNSVAQCRELLETLESTLNMRINAKRAEIEQLEIKFEQEKRNKTIELELEIKKHTGDWLDKVLDDRHEVAVSENEYDRLVNLDKSHNDKVQEARRQAIDEEREKNRTYIQSFKETLELQKRAEVCTVTAQIEQLQKHIKVLEETILNQKKEIDEQRNLTRDIASSSSQQQWYRNAAAQQQSAAPGNPSHFGH